MYLQSPVTDAFVYQLQLLGLGLDLDLDLDLDLEKNFLKFLIAAGGGLSSALGGWCTGG